MCARFELSTVPGDLPRRFGTRIEPEFPPAPDLRPTDRVPVVTASGLAPRRWGLPAPWDGKPLINARAETLAEKTTFRPLLEHRCLVPATAYFEWRRDGRRRFRNRIAPVDGGIMAFAGLTDGTHVTIVTCAPAPGLAHIHDRMPVILANDAEAPWIDPDRPFAAVASSLRAFAGGLAATEDAPPSPAQGRLF